jgi:hypothetical protein
MNIGFRLYFFFIIIIPRGVYEILSCYYFVSLWFRNIYMSVSDILENGNNLYKKKKRKNQIYYKA